MNAHSRIVRKRPLILGIGGTTRAMSSSERALRGALDHARSLGAETECLIGSELVFAIYDPQNGERPAELRRYVELVRRCDGLIIASPGYHGTMSGLIKNALDYIEDLREDERPYLTGRAVGCIACAAGTQAVGSTLSMLRSIAHALRGWPTPLGVGINTAHDENAVPDADVAIGILARQTVGFAMAARNHVAELA